MKNMFTRFLALTLTMLMLFVCAAGAQAATLTLPSGLKTIESEAFSGAVMLDRVVLPEGITAIGSRAFADSSLTSINLPRSITSIAADAFENSPNLTAYVKSGSYAHTFCAENGITHEVETVALPSSGVPVSVSTTQTSIAMGEEDLVLTFTSDNGETLGDDEWYDYSIVYLNAAGEVIDADNYGDNEFGTWSYWLECAGAVKAIITVTNSECAYPGEHPSVEVALTGSDSYVYYDWNAWGNGYPGGKMRVSIVAMNADKMTGTQTVTLTDPMGSFTLTGTLSSSSPKFVTDITIPTNWKCYDENGDYVDYRLKCTIGDQTRYLYLNVESLCDPWVTVREGRTKQLYTRMLPSEMPYTFAIENTSIATIDEEGYVTGVAVGTTTGTLTSKNGIVTPFTVEVLEAASSEGGGDTEASPSEPVFYVAAARDTVIKGEEANIFYIYSETENSLFLDESIGIILNFYDENEALVGSIETSLWVSTDDYESLWADWSWWDNMLDGADYRYIEFTFGDLDYEVTEPSSARVTVINPEELGKLAFKMGNNWGTYEAGDTVTIPLTCTTPNLLAAKGSATVRPVALYTGGLEIIRDVSVASFDADTLTANVTFTVGEDVVPGEYYTIPLYCGSDRVGYYGIEIYSGLSRLASNMNMLVGESCPLPIALAEGASYDNLYYEIADSSIVSIDRNGVVTALGEGYTEVEIYYDCGYGQTSQEWMNIEVYEPASETPATLTVTPLADNAVFGETMPVKVQLSELVTDDYGNPAYIYFSLQTNFLDKNKNSLTNNSRWFNYTADQLVDEGIVVDLNTWGSGWDIYNAAYVTIVPRYDGGSFAYVFDFDYTAIPLTGVPKPGSTTWGLTLENPNSISQGDWVEFRVYRLPQDTGYNSEISIRDANGNVLSSATYPDGNYSMYLSFTSETFAVGEHTVYLYVDGEKVEDVSGAFTIEEAQVQLSGFDRRMSIGSTRTLNYYYDSDYDCEVTFSSSNPEVASITDGNLLTALTAGTTTVSATCVHGKTSTRNVIVYNPNSSVVPEFYLLPYENQDLEWMEHVQLILGTQSDLAQIPSSSLSVRMNVQLLDADGNVVYDELEEAGWCSSLYHSLMEHECQTGWNDNSCWIAAAERDARYIRFVIFSESSTYTVDADRSTITLEIPPLNEYPYPVVTVDYPSSIQTGGTIDVTFTCLNPNALTRSREVRIEDYYDDSTLVSGWLTAENPVVTLSYDPGEDFTGGRIQYRYPSFESSTNSASFYVTVSAYTGLGRDTKIAVGGMDYMYPEYTGSMPNLTVTSSDESVATAELYGSYAMNGMARDGGYIIVTGVGAGTATITGTDIYGVSHSFKVVVYDSSNVVTPVFGLDPAQSGEVQWQDYHELTVVTANEPHTFGRPSLNIQKEYLDADGNVLLTTSVSMQTENGFLTQTEIADTYVDMATMASLYAEGARSIRFTLTAGSYTVDESTASVTLPIANPDESEEPIIIHTYPTYSIKGGTYDVSFTCLNPAALGDGVLCTVKGEKDPQKLEFLLTPDNPAASVTLSVPADYVNNVYYVHINVGNNGYSYNVPLLRGTISTGGALSIGSTTTLSCYLYNTAANLTQVWASENEEVATVDQNGRVTAVAPGQTTITMTYGPLVLSTGVRVYDPNGELETPELYITGDTTQPVSMYNNTYFNIGTSTDLAALGSGVSVTYMIDYLNASGATVCREESSYGMTLYFAESNQETIERYNSNTLANAVAAGATQMRIRLDNTYSSYTIDPERASVIFPIADTSEWGQNTFGFSSQAVYHGENTLHMKLVSVWSGYAETDCLITMNVTDQNGNYLLQDATVTVSMASPDAYFAFTIPEEVTSVNCRYSYQFENSGTSSNSFYPKLVTITQAQSDTTVAVGGTMTAIYSGNNLNAVIHRYESSNPAIAAVDSDGVVTGVSAGVATITAHIGELESSFKVRVYDESTMVQANLSLSAPETTTEWSWSGEGDLIVTADQPVENLGRLTQVTIRTTFTKENGTGFSHTSYHNVSMIDSNTVVIHLASNSSYMHDAVESGYTGIKHELYSYSGSGFSINSNAKTVELPMQALSDYPDPMLEVGSIAYTNMVSGKEYEVPVHAVNNTVSEPVTVVGYANISGTRYDMGSLTFTPSESADAALIVTAPSGVTVSAFYLSIAQQAEDGTETALSSQYCYLTPLPALTTATTLAELQSAHPYANSMNQAWAYTVEGATSLSVTFDSQTATESPSYDPLKVGSLAAFENGSLENTYGNSIGAITVDVTGDTVVIWLKSDGSVNRYGFAVTQIVATMADGTTVTITE